MQDHSDHNKEDTDLCQEVSLVSGGMKSSLMNGCGNAHVRFRWNRRSDRDPGDGMAILSANQSTLLHDKP